MKITMNSFFELMLNSAFYLGRYRGYKKKYNLPDDFRFNGYFIKIYGDGKLIIGRNSYISFFSHITMAKGTIVTIGSDVSIAHNVKIYTTTIDTREFIMNGNKVSVNKNVTIGTNVLIGTNVFINPGVSIGDNVVIGANSVVTKSIESNSVAGGSPCKVIKVYRD